MTEAARIIDAAPGPTVDHATYVGGSDIGAVAGVSPYSTALDVWGEKVGVGEKFEGNDATEMGNEMERPILTVYARRKGYTLTFPGTLLDPDEPYLGATPDAITDTGRGVQCKLVGIRQAHRWGDPLDGPDGIPPEVYLQVHWEARAIRRTLGLPVEVEEVVASIGTDLRVYEVPVDDEVIEGLEGLARSFWHGHVLTKQHPIIEDWGSDKTKRMLNAIYPREQGDKLDPMPDDLAELCRQYADARECVKRYSEIKDELGAKICAAIGSKVGFEGDGIKCTWKHGAGKPSWKQIAYAAGATKEMIKKHTPSGQRSLNVTVPKNKGSE